MADTPLFIAMDRFIFHVDANSAFLSWTAAYRIHLLGEKVDLRDIPSIIGGDQEKRHGIVLAKSVPAKKYGIQTGEAIMTARQKCPELVIVPPDYGLYVNASRAFMEILRKYSDHVIQYSIDEAWVEFSGYGSIYGEGREVELALLIKNEIYKELGFTVNIGISTNFLLSKMAGDLSKPNKVHTLFPEEIPVKMWPLPVSELFFVGRATTRKLNNLGITTIGELAHADEDMIRAHLKTMGTVVQSYARGGDLEPYMYTHEANKGYGNSLTAPQDITTYEYADHLLLSLCETVGVRLRTDGVKVSVVSVHITTYEFQYFNKQMQLLSPTDVTEEIYHAACRVFRLLWDGKTPIRQIGVHTSKVQTDAVRQYNLFDRDKYDRLAVLDRTIDRIRERYGEASIFRASFLGSNVDHMSGGLDKERRSGVTIGIDMENEKVRAM